MSRILIIVIILFLASLVTLIGLGVALIWTEGETFHFLRKLFSTNILFTAILVASVGILD